MCFHSESQEPVVGVDIDCSAEFGIFFGNFFLCHKLIGSMSVDEHIWQYQYTAYQYINFNNHANIPDYVLFPI